MLNCRIVAAAALLVASCSQSPTDSAAEDPQPPPGPVDPGEQVDDNAVADEPGTPDLPTDPGDPLPEPAVSYYKDIKPLIEGYCLGCHTKGGIRESVPFETYEQVAAMAPLIRQKVVDREMPPYLAGPGCNEYWFDERLEESEIQLVSDWVDDGAPAGSQTVAPNPTPDVQHSSMSRVDLTLEMAESYVPDGYPDDYRCFLIDWPLDKEAFVTGFRANPGNPTVVHHVIAYVVPPNMVDTFQGYDDADPEHGYTCFGSPGGGAAGFTGGVRWLGGWAPGGTGSDFPPDTGIAMEPGSKIALQVHYNVLTADPTPDLTSISLKLDDQVAKPAFVLPWTNVYWVISDSMNIPAGDADVTYGFAWDPTSVDLLGLTGEPLTIYSATLHMHELGTGGRIFIDRQSGDEECLLDIPRWDFGWQRSFGLKKPTTLYPGDRLGLSCTWDNSPANQKFVDGQQLPAQDVKWGDGTQDEMCLGVFYMTVAD